MAKDIEDPSRVERRRYLERKVFGRRRGQPPVPEVPPYARPKTRADCVDGPRPCPYVGCRYNLSLDVSHSGSIRYRMGVDWDHDKRLRGNCALDQAERGARSLRRLEQLMGTCRANLDLEAQSAYRKLQEKLGGVLATVYLQMGDLDGPV